MYYSLATPTILFSTPTALKKNFKTIHKTIRLKIQSFKKQKFTVAFHTELNTKINS